MFQKIAHFIEHTFPNKYGEILSLFIAKLSIIKLIGIMMLALWNAILFSLLFNNTITLMSGTYLTGRVEDIVSRQRSYHGSVETSYSAIIGYTMNSSHHTFKSYIIGNQPLGTRFTLVMSPNGGEIYTLVGVILVSCGIICFMVQFIPIYLMIGDYIIAEMNQRKSMGNDIGNTKSLLEKWVGILAYGWISGIVLISAFFVYFH